MAKALSTLISFVLVTAIIIVAISVVLSIGLPAIDRAKEAALISEAKNIMQSIDSTARQVLFEGNGAQRVFSISSTGGDYFSEKSADRILFKLNSISGIIDPGTRKTEGNLLITAGTDVKTYETNYSADPSLVGYWKFNSVNSTNYTLDFTPNHNDGRLYNYPCDPAICNLTAGQIGNALQFDGVNDYVAAGNATSLNITNAISIEAWVKLNSKSTYQYIVSKRNSDNNIMPYELTYHQLSNRFYFQVYDGSWHSVADTISPDIGVWYHLLAVFNGSNLTIYRDTIKTVGDALASLPSNTANVAIGRAGDKSFNYFNGTIDEVKIYNRSLSADEIRQQYYEGLKKLELGTNLVLENSHVIFEVPKFGLPSSYATINNSQLVDKITLKDSGLNITPADSSTIIDNSLLSVNGTGYTQLMQTGDMLREASIKAYIQSDSGANYEIWYTLRSNADFVLEEVKNIVYR